MKTNLLVVFLLLISSKCCLSQRLLPADKGATRETVNLYNNLKKSLQKGILIGHQDDYAYGVNWKYEPGRSDVKDVTGDYPGVIGCELGRIELDWSKDLDGVPFDSTRHYIQQAYNRGSVITISWHLNNPYTGKTAWDPAPGTVAAILPNGEKNDLYKSWLNKVAVFMQSLKGSKGEAIPVIFRPFHELNGSWFWWGKANCTPDELKKLYQFTEHYLRDVKGVHNLLYAYNTDRFATKEEFMERYPGDAYVDVIGFDIYQKGDVAANETFITDLDKSLTTLEAIAKERDKIPALTEFGYNEVPDSTWWTNVLWQGLKNHHIAYALAWRNAGDKGNGEVEYWMPYKGQQSAADFVKFYNLPQTLFAKDAEKEKLYQ
ncbi:MAG: glycoside hydrolase family 26 protein [Bacteroidota bacterium]|nr:glycoside hydrolase family 26 protein [Bacteroidota bacterium]